MAAGVPLVRTPGEVSWAAVQRAKEPHATVHASSFVRLTDNLRFTKCGLSRTDLELTGRSVTCRRCLQSLASAADPSLLNVDEVSPSTTPTVWVVEHGDYDERGIVLVAATDDAAVKAVKDSYPPPYIVRWDRLCGSRRSGRRVLTGHFEAVQHFSTKHQDDFEIQRWSVST